MHHLLNEFFEAEKIHHVDLFLAREWRSDVELSWHPLSES